MARTTIPTEQIRDSNIFRADLNVSTNGSESVISSIVQIANSGIVIYSSTNPVGSTASATGTGDVGLSLDFSYLNGIYSVVSHTHTISQITDFPSQSGNSGKVLSTNGSTLSWISVIAQIQSDWNQTNTSSLDYIKNKPTIPAQVNLTGGTDISITGSYPNLTIASTATIPAQFNLIAGTGISLSGSYPNITVNTSLATVSYTGSYNDLINKPTIPAQVNLAAGTNVTITGSYPNLTINASGTSGSYIQNQYSSAQSASFWIDGNASVGNSLTVIASPGGTPYIILSGGGSSADAGRIAIHNPLTYSWEWTYKGNEDFLLTYATTSTTSNILSFTAAGVATINNLGGTGTRFVTASSTGQLSTAVLATVATTGDYNDLINKPTIGTGSVTSVSFNNANGFTGSISNSTTIPAITVGTSITGLLKGNGTGISAATPGTDYLVSNQTITASGDVSGSGTTSLALTLATVNSNVGTFGSSTLVPVITVNAKGLITAISTTTVSSGTTTNPAGSSGQIQFNNSGSFGASANFFWDNTNNRLGIGSNSLTSKLYINTLSSSETGQIIQAVSGQTANFVEYWDYAHTSSLPVVYISQNGVGGLITATANNPADPSFSAISQGANFGFNGAPSNFYGMGLGSIRNSSYDIWFQTGHANGGGYRFYFGSGVDAEKITFDKYGNLGIGTTSPSQALHVVGNVLITLLASGSTAPTTSGTTKMVVTDANGQLSFASIPSSGGSGTVTSVSVSSANGFTGSVSSSTTTPAISIGTSITGLLKGNGSSVSAATAGTDYLITNQTITVSGDASASGTTSLALTLATVNSNVGTFGSSTVVPVITVNAKGLITSVSTATISGGGSPQDLDSVLTVGNTSSLDIHAGDVNTTFLNSSGDVDAAQNGNFGETVVYKNSYCSSGTPTGVFNGGSTGTIYGNNQAILIEYNCAGLAAYTGLVTIALDGVFTYPTKIIAVITPVSSGSNPAVNDLFITTGSSNNQFRISSGPTALTAGLTYYFNVIISGY